MRSLAVSFKLLLLSLFARMSVVSLSLSVHLISTHANLKNEVRGYHVSSTVTLLLPRCRGNSLSMLLSHYGHNHRSCATCANIDIGSCHYHPHHHYHHIRRDMETQCLKVALRMSSVSENKNDSSESDSRLQTLKQRATALNISIPGLIDARELAALIVRTERNTADAEAKQKMRRAAAILDAQRVLIKRGLLSDDSRISLINELRLRGIDFDMNMLVCTDSDSDRDSNSTGNRSKQDSENYKYRSRLLLTIAAYDVDASAKPNSAKAFVNSDNSDDNDKSLFTFVSKDFSEQIDDSDSAKIGTTSKIGMKGNPTASNRFHSPLSALIESQNALLECDSVDAMLGLINKRCSNLGDEAAALQWLSDLCALRGMKVEANELTGNGVSDLQFITDRLVQSMLSEVATRESSVRGSLYTYKVEPQKRIAEPLEDTNPIRLQKMIDNAVTGRAIENDVNELPNGRIRVRRSNRIGPLALDVTLIRVGRTIAKTAMVPIGIVGRSILELGSAFRQLFESGPEHNLYQNGDIDTDSHTHTNMNRQTSKLWRTMDALGGYGANAALFLARWAVGSSDAITMRPQSALTWVVVLALIRRGGIAEVGGWLLFLRLLRGLSDVRRP